MALTTIGRRQLIAAMGGWPLAARAQQSNRMRRIGVLMNRAADNAEGQARLAAFQQGLQQLGWIDGRNVRIDMRWGEDDAGRERKYAAELVALAPDVIFVAGTLGVAALQNFSRTLPIVFASVTDPVGAGFVDSLAQPGGNATGFMIYEYSLGSKWLQLLKEIAPGVTRVGIVRNAANPAGVAVFSALQNAAQSFGIDARPINTRDPAEIERSVQVFAGPNSGLIVTPSTSLHRDLIIAAAARYKLPAVYGNRYDVTAGGLISYANDIVDQFREAATYVDRVLKGEKPADLPVQAPTKYALVINLKTAKALGLAVPQTLIAQADEVIE
jgi:putative ABC transport system substrate-binding protein